MQWRKRLSEAILLQSLDDLYSKHYRMDALRFFNGEGFSICASIIGLNHEESQKIFDIVKKITTIKQSVPTQIRNKVKHIPEVKNRVLHRNLRHGTVCHP